MRRRYVEVREATPGSLTGTFSRLLRDRIERVGRQGTRATRRRLPGSPQPIEQGWCGDSIRPVTGRDRPLLILDPDVQAQRPGAWFCRVLKPSDVTRRKWTAGRGVRRPQRLPHVRRCHPISCGQISFGKKRTTFATPPQSRTRLHRTSPTWAGTQSCRWQAGVLQHGLPPSEIRSLVARPKALRKRCLR